MSRNDIEIAAKDVALSQGSGRLYIFFLIIGVSAAIAAASLLWIHEGSGVFLSTLLAGIAACF